jgi:uncharacterized protein YkwD
MGMLAGGLAMAACGVDAPRPAPTAVQPSAIANCGFANFSAAALARINQARAAGANCRSAGRFASARPLVWSNRLAQVAAQHTRDMAANNFFSHTGRDGRDQRQRIDAAGYVWGSIGENIDAGSTSVNDAIESWMASDGHCANVMSPAFTEVGVACVRGGTGNTYETYWTMEMAKPR